MKTECDSLKASSQQSEANKAAISQEESNILLTVVPDTTSFHILRLLLQLFDLKTLHAARCFRAMKKLSDNLTRKKAIQSQANEIAAATDDVSASHASIKGRESIVSAHSAASPNPIAYNVDDIFSSPSMITMDSLLSNDSTRRMVIRLWKEWDGSGIDIDHFTDAPEQLHLYLPQRNSNKMRVFRDFCFCTPRPKLTKQWGSAATCHIKTNIPKKSDIMYRILVEGYNYGVNAVVFSDVVGYTNRNWEQITDLEQYGWPSGWDSEMANDYAPGAAISQYYSTDGFLVVRLRAKSMFCMGFSVSAWMVFHGFGAGFPISASIHHQDDQL
eukprot:GDKJ01042981.1.p1 GENE.GDKJ01042981.1~~GDKJ01042981.1.p1  ORF type:complete len:337 (-),score=8.00 GDKJ01042981.1:48-1034(-)